MRTGLPLLILACALPARADIKQPDGTTIPKPAIGCYGGKPGGLGAVFACLCDKPGVCNIGAPCPGGSTSCDLGKNATCETTIWHTVNDDPCIPTNLSGLDPVKDAAVQPETFRPVCGLKFGLVTRGGALFKNAFGWYNVDPGGKAPDAKDLHVLIDCNAQPGASVPFDLFAQPDYKGGDVAFFIVTPESHTKSGDCASGNCCASLARAAAGEGYIYYSQPKFNPDQKGTGSFIHLLIYNSKITPYKYYFTWEDIYAGSLSNDFSDFVTSVEGISCSGAGLQCDTGKPGLCGLGVTKCTPDGKTVCEPANQPTAEACDGLDNDCDGQVDDDATCSAGLKCYQGVCVGSCQSSQEFACQIGYECDPQLALCVDTKCKGKLCPPGQICRAGLCGNGCDGVVCPPKQVCQGGLCVDLCAGKKCAQGELCKLGVCVPDCLHCGGLTCTGGLSCHKTTGDCYDASCNPECGAGTTCKAGKCVGLCDGVVCPGGVACEKGLCPPPGVGKKAPAGDGGGTLPPTPGSDAGVGGKEAGPGAGFTGDEGGCNCSLEGSAPLGSLWLLALLALLARRRR
jgi:MYXO-CTERM domain-containing protein